MRMHISQYTLYGYGVLHCGLPPSLSLCVCLPLSPLSHSLFLSLSLIACQELRRLACHAFRMSKISCTKKCAVCLFMVRKEERHLENNENKISQLLVFTLDTRSLFPGVFGEQFCRNQLSLWDLEWNPSSTYRVRGYVRRG